MNGYQGIKWIEALLISIDDEIARLYWNKYQKEWLSPLGRDGGYYKNSTFELKSYDWDNEKEQYNFKFGDFTISWYKHVKRGLEVSRDIDAEEFVFMYEECIQSLYEDEFLKKEDDDEC